MNIYKKLIHCIKLSENQNDFENNDFYVNNALRLAQSNDNIDKDALIMQLQNNLNAYVKAYNDLNLRYQNLASDLVSQQNTQGYSGDGGPQLKPSENIAGATDIFFDSNDIARTVIQDGSNLQARIEHNENIPVLINTK